MAVTYAHAPDGTVKTVTPPIDASIGGRWRNLADVDPGVLNSHGWFPVEEAPRPDDTDETVHVATYTIDGDVAVQTWTPTPRDPADVAVRVAETALRDAEAALGVLVARTNADINTNPAAAIKDVARALLTVARRTRRELT